MADVLPAPSRITVRVRCAADAGQLAWLTLGVRPEDGQQLRFAIDIAKALASDPVSFLHQLPPNQQQIIKAEIVGGLLTTRRHAKRGCSVELLGLGGANGEERSLAGIPSVGFAVAATLALLQGLGIEDLRIKPRGGWGFHLEAIEVADLPSASA